MVIEIARRFDDWLAQIGFRSQVLDDGSHYFHVYEHEDGASGRRLTRPERRSPR
jgi:hypothetical protein